ncbi:neuronal acetylcholine receptor subunit alpha-9-like [Ptychodera flava]|uniref:neuronal acetylcholine receptor subunit alpha-9-like n=1 Tax=Ptychodera flava TaxID=63121 RepID=UPI00396A7A53
MWHYGSSLRSWLCLCGVISFQCMPAGSRAASRYVNMAQDLLSNYPRHTRPVTNIATVTNVTHTLFPVQILDVDEKNQILTLKAWLTVAWHDEFLTWNASEYDGITSVLLPSKAIWQPDITVYESVKEEFARHLDTEAFITNDGEVTAPALVIIETSCVIDATYFPFDEQICVLTFGSWSYDGSMIDLYLDDRSGNLEYYVTNGEWDLVGFPARRNSVLFSCCPNPYIDVKYSLQIRRRSLFYINIIIIPSVLLFVLVLTGFYLPATCGEKMTLFVNSMLALIVFLTLTSKYMPPTSESSPYLERYLVSLIVMVALSCLLAAITVEMHFKSATCSKMPEWLRACVFKYLSKFVCMRSQSSTSLDPKVGETNGSIEIPQAINQDHLSSNGHLSDGVNHDKSCISSHEPIVERKMELRDSDDGPKENIWEWQLAAKIIDRFFLVCYSVTFLVMSIGILTYLHTRASEP